MLGTILIVVLINVRHRVGLERAREELRASEALATEKSRELELTLDHMAGVDEIGLAGLDDRQHAVDEGLPAHPARHPVLELEILVIRLGSTGTSSRFRIKASGRCCVTLRRSLL